MIKFILAVVVLLGMAHPCAAWQARVVAIVDGDTLRVEKCIDNSIITIRLHGIDAPERKQAHGDVAKTFIIERALYHRVEVEEKGWDRYGRLVAVIYLLSGESLQALLLEAGLAWVWPKYCLDCDDWEQIQNLARRNQRGIWVDPAAIPP